MKKLTIILTTLLCIHPGTFSQSEGLNKLLPEASELDNVALVGDPERGESYHLEMSPLMKEIKHNLNVIYQ